MRKLFIIISAFGLIIGCDTANYRVSITNRSGKVVTYSYNGVPCFLSVAETKTYKVKEYTLPPTDIVDQDKIASIKLEMDYKTGNYLFTDAEYYYLTVINLCPFDMTISAGNVIDQNVIVATAGTTTDTGAIVYTKNPRFTSTLGSSVVFELLFPPPLEFDNLGKLKKNMIVTIRASTDSP